jgi:hypothetical protein
VSWWPKCRWEGPPSCRSTETISLSGLFHACVCSQKIRGGLPFIEEHTISEHIAASRATPPPSSPPPSTTMPLLPSLPPIDLARRASRAARASASTVVSPLSPDNRREDDEEFLSCNDSKTLHPRMRRATRSHVHEGKVGQVAAPDRRSVFDA